MHSVVAAFFSGGLIGGEWLDGTRKGRVKKGSVGQRAWTVQQLLPTTCADRVHEVPSSCSVCGHLHPIVIMCAVPWLPSTAL